MKHFILAAALLGATATTAFAQGVFPPPPSAEVIKAGKQTMISNTTLLESSIKKNKTDQAEQAASQILRGMKNHVRDTRLAAEAKTGADRDVLMKRMLMLEDRVLVFMTDMKNVSANGAKLVSQARTFTNDY